MTQTAESPVAALAAAADADAAKQRAEVAALRQRYAAILFRNADPAKGDGKALAEVVAALGLDVQTVKADLDRVTRYQKTAAKAAELEATGEAMLAARRAAKAAKETLEAETVRLTEAAKNARFASENAEHKWDVAHDAAQTLPMIRDELQAAQLWPESEASDG